jgi:hypothetical protein
VHSLRAKGALRRDADRELIRRARRIAAAV